MLCKEFDLPEPVRSLPPYHVQNIYLWRPFFTSKQKQHKPDDIIQNSRNANNIFLIMCLFIKIDVQIISIHRLLHTGAKGSYLRGKQHHKIRQ